MAHLADGMAVYQRPAYYDLIKFAVEKEVEINFDEAKKTRDSALKPNATTQFHFQRKDLVKEEGSGDSGKSDEATQEDATISQGDTEIVVRVAQASETFTGQSGKSLHQ